MRILGFSDFRGISRCFTLSFPMLFLLDFSMLFCDDFRGAGILSFPMILYLSGDTPPRLDNAPFIFQKVMMPCL